jgi:hypothetical protein
MPAGLRADIDWHRASIAFYEQALAELGDAPDKASRQESLRTIIEDLHRTLGDLERLLRQKGG